jgi:hypothetical protein
MSTARTTTFAAAQSVTLCVNVVAGQIKRLREHVAVDGDRIELAERARRDILGRQQRLQDVLAGARRIIVISRDADLRVQVARRQKNRERERCPEQLADASHV